MPSTRSSFGCCIMAARRAWLRRPNSSGNVVVANTFTRRYELASYQAIAAALGVHVEIVVATGTYANVHAVPDATLAAMQARWED